MCVNRARTGLWGPGVGNRPGLPGRGTQCVQSAYVRVIYKEDRDIVEPNDATFATSMEQLESARRAFRDLNRALRAASFSVVIDFTDE